MVIDAGLLPPLITILQVAEFRTRKEAAWAITNATSGGSAEQIRYKLLHLNVQCTASVPIIVTLDLSKEVNSCH